MQKRCGFTLVEILTVIGIIALLAALLVPVFFMTRRQSQKTTCQSNLHQVYVALRQYADDNEGTWPNSDTWERKWERKSFASVSLNGCPQAIPAPRPYSKALEGIPGYSYNTAFTRLGRGQYVGINDQAIRYPSTTAAVCEEAIGRGATYGPDPYHNTNPGAPEGEEKGWLRHNGGANYLFADGHTKWYVPDAVGYNETPNKDAGVRPTFALAQTKQP